MVVNECMEPDKTIKAVMEILNNYDSLSAVPHLSKIDRNQLLEALSQIISKESFELRHKATEVAVRVDPQRGMMLIIPLLNDEDGNIRWLVAGLLGSFGNERAIEPLVQCLENDPDADIRQIAAFSLGKIGDLGVVPHLEKMLDDKGGDYEGRTVMAAAKEAIERIQARNK